MKKNKTGRLNLKKTDNNTATSTNVEKNPTPKSQTKQEKEAAKKAHAAATIAKKAEVKAANVKKNEEAQMKNQNNGQPLSRRAKESYKHFLRRKRRAKKREALLAKQNATPVEKKYSLLINYNNSMKDTVLAEMKNNNLNLDISTDTYSYVKTLTKEELDKYIKILNAQSIKDKYLEEYVKKWEKNHPKSKADTEAWNEKRKAAIRKERARIDNLKSPLTFQAVKEGTIISSTVKKTEKKPSGNTTEKKIAAHNNRKAFNKAKACKWRVNKDSEDKLPRRLKKLYKKTSIAAGTNAQTTSKTASEDIKTAA